MRVAMIAVAIMPTAKETKAFSRWKRLALAALVGEAVALEEVVAVAEPEPVTTTTEVAVMFASVEVELAVKVVLAVKVELATLLDVVTVLLTRAVVVERAVLLALRTVEREPDVVGVRGVWVTVTVTDGPVGLVGFGRTTTSPDVERV